MAITLRPKRQQLEPTTDLDLLVNVYLDAKQAKDRASLVFAEVEAQLLNALGDTKTTQVAGKKLTVVRGDRTKVDEAKLKKIVGAKLYNKMTTAIFDRKKLESLISLGEVSVDQVASASEIVPNKPFVRVSDVQETDEQEEP